MNTRDKINSIIRTYKSELSSVTDGAATIAQQNKINDIISELEFYTHQIMLFGNYEVK